MSFGSDNQSGASPAVLQALLHEFSQKGASYGTDEATKQAEDKLREVFDCDLVAYFVTSGTAANCLALSALGDPWGRSCAIIRRMCCAMNRPRPSF